MPSPLAHASMALLVAPLALRAAAGDVPRMRRAALAGLVLFGTVAADIDIALGFAAGLNGFEVHGGYSHSLLAAIVFALLCIPLGRWLAAVPPAPAFGIGLLAYGSHLLLDGVNYGRGIALLWPFTDDRFHAPFRLFHGVRHSVGAHWTEHLTTLVTESVFVLVVMVTSWFIYGRHRKVAPP